MTQAEKQVLTEIVDLLEKTTNAVREVQDRVGVHSLVSLPRKLDTLRTKISDLPSR